MTPIEHSAKTRALGRAVKTAKKALIECNGLLTEKIELKRKLKDAEQALHDHKLFYFDLVQ